MGLGARLKSMAGGVAIPTIASVATLSLPDDSNAVFLTGSTPITSLNAGKILPGRRMQFIRSGTDRPVFTNTQATTTAGQMDFFSSASTFILEDSVTLTQRNDGSWCRTEGSVVN